MSFWWASTSGVDLLEILGFAGSALKNLILRKAWRRVVVVKTLCEIYSRVVGYIRPVSNWNDSKQAEFKDRKVFDIGNKQTKLVK